MVQKPAENLVAKARKAYQHAESKMRPKTSISCPKIGVEKSSKQAIEKDEPTTPFSPGPPQQMYQQYLQEMEKKIHDEKMARFQEHAKKVKEASERNKEVVETAPKRKRVDTGLN